MKFGSIGRFVFMMNDVHGSMGGGLDGMHGEFCHYKKGSVSLQ